MHNDYKGQEVTLKCLSETGEQLFLFIMA